MISCDSYNTSLIDFTILARCPKSRGKVIPFLCIALVKGVGSFVHLASHLSNVTQGAASQAATEATTGNYSFGNITEGSRQISNTSMLNHSYAASFRSGSFQQADGRSDLITSADGQQILNVSSSNLPISLNVAETQSAQLSEQASRSYQTAMNKSESYAKSMAETLRQSVDLSDHMSKSQQSSDHYNEGKSIEQSESLSKSAQIVKDFAKNNNLTVEQSSQVIAAASIGGDKGLSVLGKLLGVSGSISGNVIGEANIQEAYQKAERVTQGEDFQSALRQTTQSVHNQSFTQNDEKGKRLAEGIANSWDESNNFREEASKSFREAEDYNHQASVVKNSAASINANHTQEFVNWLSKQKADNTGGHIGARGAAHIIANEPTIRLGYAQRFLAENKLLPSTPSELETSSPNNLKASYQNDSSHSFIKADKSSALTNMDALKQKGSNEMEIRNSHLVDSFNNKQAETQQKISDGEQRIAQEQSVKQSQHEEKSKKNLTALAAKQGLKHITDVGSNIINSIKGEKQSE